MKKRETAVFDQVRFEKKDYLWQIMWLRPFLACLGHKPQIDKFGDLENKLKKEISIVTVLKRI